MLGTLAQLATRVDGRTVGDASVLIAGIAAVEDADDTTLTFATDERYLERALEGSAAGILVETALVEGATYSKPLLVVGNVRAALATLLTAFEPARPQGPYRHPSAVIDPTAILADDVYIDAHAFVGAHACVDPGSIIGVGAYVGPDARLGSSCWLHPHARVMDRCVLGSNVVLHAGSTVGSEGFGWAFMENRLRRIPQIGNVVLGDDVEVGVNTCIDRAQTGSTTIGCGTKIDNLVQIGHNCRVGRHGAIAALSGLAGTTVIGDFVRVGGQVGFKGHLTVGSGVTIAGGSHVWGDIPDGTMVSGTPAREHRERLRFEVQLRNLPKLIARVEALERSRARD